MVSIVYVLSYNVVMVSVYSLPMVPELKLCQLMLIVQVEFDILQTY